MPMLSLDGMREVLDIGSKDNQGKVIQTAQEKAKEYLRKKQPFIWNATDLMKETRQKLTGLFEQYGARVRIVYLETDWETRVERNQKRKDTVPEATVGRMLSKAIPPMPDEAQTVEWICV